MDVKQKFRKSVRTIHVIGYIGTSQAMFCFQQLKLRDDIGFQRPRGAVIRIEAQAHDWVRMTPVPAVMDVQSLEQRLIALEQLPHGVQQQALAKPPRPRQEAEPALADQPLKIGRLVDQIAAVGAHRSEGRATQRIGLRVSVFHKGLIYLT